MDRRDVFILGAGFSKAINYHMPTTQELTRMIGPEINNELPPPLRDAFYQEKQLEDDIEVWLAYLSQTQPWLSDEHNSDNKELAERIRKLIIEIIKNHSLESATSLSWQDWLGSLIKYWAEHKSMVITLNYDTLVERAAMSLGISPSQIYPDYIANIAPSSVGILGMPEERNFTYYKLHGSVNWYHIQNRTSGGTIYYSDVSRWGYDDQQETDSHAFTEDKTPILIPPVIEKASHFNDETIRALWNQASSAVQGASRIFVMGYSLPSSDLGMRFFLKRNQPNPQIPWYIINRDKKMARHYQQLLEPLQTINDDFVGKVNAIKKFVKAYPELPLILNNPPPL